MEEIDFNLHAKLLSVFTGCNILYIRDRYSVDLWGRAVVTAVYALCIVELHLIEMYRAFGVILPGGQLICLIVCWVFLFFFGLISQFFHESYSSFGTKLFSYYETILKPFLYSLF